MSAFERKHSENEKNMNFVHVYISHQDDITLDFYENNFAIYQTH